MKFIWLLLLISAGISTGFSVGVSAAGNIEAGKNKALLCQTCHGELGISDIGIYPNLAGQQQLYLTLQLRNFKSGSRPSAVMAAMANVLSEQDIDNLAAYYASLKN